MINLTGTPEQIAKAEAIRAQRLTALQAAIQPALAILAMDEKAAKAAFAAMKNECVTELLCNFEDEASLTSAVAKIERQSSASFWIQKGGYDIGLMLTSAR